VKTSLLTPYDKGDAKPAGRNLWRKQLLPIAKINYQGRVIDFTKDYLASLVTAFNARAYDQVPFQLADAKNTHTEDPERFRGEIAALELTADGLDMIVAASDAGAAVLRENPHLGVSAKIAEDYPRADGKFFPLALKHVLGTLDPRLTGMRPWEAIEAANDEGDVIDLTALEYATPQTGADAPEKPVQQAPAEPGTPATEDTNMAFTADQEARLAKLLDLPAEQFDALLTPPEKPAEGGTDGGEELTDAELDELVSSLEGAGDIPDGGDAKTAEPKELQPVGASLSSEAQTAIDLANARTEETAAELRRVKHSLAVTAYEAERDNHFARTCGIPPRIVDLARPLLEGEGRTVELSNGKNVDAGAIMRKVLEEIGKTVRMLDLSVELGTPVDGAAEAAAAAEADTVTARQDLVSTVRKMAGI
jgi:hypothetical protein